MAQPAHLPLLALALLACGTPQDSAVASGADVVLDNGALRIVLDAASGYGVASVLDQASGVDLLGDPDTAPTLFRVDVPDGGQLRRLTQADAEGATATLDAGGRRVSIAYERIGGRALSAVATLTLHGSEPELELHLRVETARDGVRYERVRFPYLSGYAGLGADPSDDVFVAPRLFGELVEDPLAITRQGRSLPLELAVYPGNLSMQFTALYDEGAGFYLACEDTTGRVKSLWLQLASRDGRSASLSFQHHIPPSESVVFETDFPIRLAVLEGDWVDACERYREWALRQPWCAERADPPAWFQDPLPVLDYRNFRSPGPGRGRRLPPDEAERVAAEFLAGLDGPYALFAPGWEQHGPWAGPEIFPPRDGEDALAGALDALHARGDRFMHMFCVSMWVHPHGAETPLYLEEGAAARLMQRSGEEYHLDDELGPLGKTHLMCPGTEAWRARAVATTRECVERGVDLFQLDLFPRNQPLECWDPAHPHPSGLGRWWYEGWVAICEGARAAALAANPEAVLSAEEMCELYLPYFENYLSREERRDRLVLDAEAVSSATGPAPLFQHVYHEFATALGDYAETCSLGDERAAPAIARQFARAKHLGARIPTAGELVTPAHRADLAFLADCVATLRAAGAERTLRARMVRPPLASAISVDPPLPVDWRTAHPSIGAFEAEDGTRSILLANASAEPVRVELQGVRAGRLILSGAEAAPGEVLVPGTGGRVVLHMPARASVCIIEGG